MLPVEADFPTYDYDLDLLEAARRDRRPRVRVYRPGETLVVLGAGSKPEVEVHVDACRADGVPILRRRGGGCAVVIDPGNVVVSVVMTGLPFGGYRRHFHLLSRWLIAGLLRAGVAGVRREGICDLVIGDRKVAGACLHRSKDLLYYSASLLVAPDIDKVSRYLKHPPREPDYRRGRSHTEFMGTLASATGRVPERSAGLNGAPVDFADVEQFAERLRRTLERLRQMHCNHGDVVALRVGAAEAGDA